MAERGEVRLHLIGARPGDGVADAATMTALFTTGVEYMQGDFIAPAGERMAPAY